MDPLSVPLSIGEGVRMSGTSEPHRRRRSRVSRRSQDSPQNAPIEDVYDIKPAPYPQVQERLGRARRTWHTRPKSPGIKWYRKYDEQQQRKGRIFVIDYIKKDLTGEGMRKVAAQEISHPDDLEKLFSNPKRYDEAVLRLFHVQNCDWGEDYLLKKYFAPYDDFGRDFSKYVGYKFPERRGGKAILRGKTWMTQHEPRREIIKTAFGLDYYKIFKVPDPLEMTGRDKAGKVMELNCFDEEDEHPRCGYEVFAQRISCYAQVKEVASDSSEASTSRGPSPERRGAKHFYDQQLDNSNVIVIFENAQNHSINDTLIAAREKWESRWRRLPFHLSYESDEAADDQQLALQCMKFIVKDVWRANSENWEKFLDIAGTHVAILEDRIYDFPADESQADGIWRNSNNWLKTERTMFQHLDTLREVQNSLKDIADDPSSSENAWLETNEADYERLATQVQEDLVKPTDSLSDLMYKSVGIRDSRHSLQLSYSMWRLSWITFVFLPLSFVASCFGMNVDTLQDNPSVSWFFVIAVPLMVVVLIGYNILQRTIAQRPDPYPRGVYERLFQELSSDFPLLWTRNGPRDLLAGPTHGSSGPRMGSELGTMPVRRRGFIRSRADAFKWKLVQHWNAPAETIARNVRDRADAFDGLDSWSRAKRILTRRWTAEIGKGVAKRLSDPGYAEDGRNADIGKAAMKGEGGKSPGRTDEKVHMAEADGHDEPNDLGVHVPVTVRVTKSMTEPIEAVPTPPGSERASSAGRNSNRQWMVEEHKADWLHRQSVS